MTAAFLLAVEASDIKQLSTPDGTPLLCTPIAAGSLGGTGTSFVYQPLGPASSGNRFNNWPALYTALAPLIASGAQYTVTVDPTFQNPPLVPAGAWPLGVGSFTSLALGTELVFQDGAHLDGTEQLSLRGISFGNAAGIASPTWTVSAGTVALFLLEGSDLSGASGAQPFVRVTAAAVSLNVRMNQGTLDGFANGAAGAISVDAGATALIFASGQSAAFNNALKGAGTGLLFISDDWFATGGAVGGTWSTSLAGLAQQLLYTPAVVGNWNPAPAQAAAALDQLAAPNVVQVQGVAFGPGTPLLYVAPAITAKRSNVFRLRGTASFNCNAPSTITLLWLRDGIPIPSPQVTVGSTGAGAGATVTVAAPPVDDVHPAAVAHVYTLQCAASGGAGLTTVLGQGSVVVEEI